MHELAREIEDALSGSLHGRQWAKDLFWDLLSFERVASTVPLEVLPSKDRWEIEESQTWARLGDIRVGLFKKTNGVWGDDRLDAIACKVGQVWRNALMLFADEEEMHWQLVVCTPRVEGQAGVSRRHDMASAIHDRKVICLIAELSPETATPTSKALHDLWLAGQPMKDVVTRMLYQLPRDRKRQVQQSGFLQFIRPYAMHPLLRKSEEHALGRRIQNGDQEAWHELLTRNIRMGFWGANRFAWPGVEFQEGFQHSMMGLMRAAQKFDPDQGTRFSTYAFSWMRQVCSREYYKNRSTVHVPDYQQKPVQQYIKRRSQQPYRDKPWTEEDWELDRIARLTSAESYEWARSAVHQEASDELDPALLVQARLDRNDRMGAVMSILDEFSGRDQDMLLRRFGFHDREEDTLQEIGEDYGVTRETVRQVERKLLKKLRYLLPRRFPGLFGEYKVVDSDEVPEEEPASGAGELRASHDKSYNTSKAKKTCKKKRERKTSCNITTPSDLQAAILKTLKDRPHGLSEIDLSVLMKHDITGRNAAVNELIENGRIELLKIGWMSFYRLTKMQTEQQSLWVRTHS